MRTAISHMLLYVSVSLWGSSLANADSNIHAQLTPVQIYSRCYLQLTGMIPDKTAADYLKVMAGTLKPADACIKIFDRAKLGANGLLANKSDVVARKVLGRMHAVHLNWFASKNPTAGQGTGVFMDYEEPALYFTRSAFLTNAKFSEAVTLNIGLKGAREQSIPTGATPLPIMDSQRLETRRSGNQTSNDGVATPFPTGVFRWGVTKFRDHSIGSRFHTYIDLPPSEVSEFGVLVGIKQRTVQMLSYFYEFGLLRYDTSFRPAVTEYLKGTVPLNDHFGGGILGSQGFIMANTNLIRWILPDHERELHRRVGLRVYEDLMCHQLPTLAGDDVKTEVNAKSEFNFRRKESCMTCHSSMDPASYHYQNIFVTQASRAPATGPEGYIPHFAMKAPILNDPDHFVTQSPTGRLKYRALLKSNDPPITAHTKDLVSLGNYIASTNDYYLCGAKRYYAHFTGVDVQLVSPELAGTAKEYHQQQVISLANKLKSTQSVRETLKALFSSDVYSQIDFKSKEVTLEP